MKKEAIKYLHGLGICAVPARQDKHVCAYRIVNGVQDLTFPIPKHGYKGEGIQWSWKEFQSRFPNEEELDYFYKQYRNHNNIAIITGSVSGNLEVLDIDDPTIFDELYQSILEYFEGNGHMIFIVKTKNGYHMYFRNEFDMSNPPEGVKCGNLKLANWPKNKSGEVKVRLENRGEGGYVIGPPSENYEIMHGRSFEFIPTWSQWDREAIYSICKDYNLYARPKVESNIKSNVDYKGTPWGEYNESNAWMKEIENAGWTFVNDDGVRSYWLRPGDTEAKTSASFHHELRMFKVWSSSTIFETEVPYRPSSLRCMLKYGDTSKESLSANAKDIAELGFGTSWSTSESDLIDKIAHKIKNNVSASREDIMNMMSTDLSQYSTDPEAQKEIMVVGKKKAENIERTIKAKKNNPLYHVEKHIQELNLIRNEVSKKVETIDGHSELDKTDFNSIYIDIKEKFVKVSKSLVEDYCDSNRLRSYHPFKEYFDNIEPIEGERSVLDLFYSLNVEFDDESEEIMCLGIFKKWLLQFLASAYHTGPLDIELVFTGKKNNGKTFFFENLLPKELKEYFISIKDFPRKEEDAKMILCSGLMVLRDDISGTGGKDKDWIKSILSSTRLYYRAPYGRSIVGYQRYGVLCSTTNDTGVISSDDDMQRRKFPLKVDNRDHKAFDKILKEGIGLVWGELKNIWDKSTDKRDLYRINQEEMIYLSSLSEFKEVDPIEEMILDKFEQSENFHVTTSKVMTHINTHGMRFSSVQVGIRLSRLFEKRTVRVGGVPTKVYMATMKSWGEQAARESYSSASGFN